MPYLNFNSSSSWLKLVIAFLSILTIGIIVWFAGFMLSRIFFQFDVHASNEILHGRTSQLSLTQIKYFQFMRILGFYILPGLFLGWILSTPEKFYIPHLQKPKLVSLLLMILCVLAAIPLLWWLSGISLDLAPNHASLQNNDGMNVLNRLSPAILLGNGTGTFLMNLLLFAVLQVIGEELIFRGVLQKVFLEITHQNVPSVVLTALLFGIFGWQPAGFIPGFFAGLMFGFILVWSGNIWLPIAAHFILKTLLVVVSYFNPQAENIPDGNLLEISTPVLLVAFSLLIAVMFFFRRYEKKVLN
ncbi:MAG: CPBP family intramembrane metalloprotease [Bacteroidota bacterium]|nr:MAG: CPBP family intramembrane metalloprotease [Bacteroidota bacterium]